MTTPDDDYELLARYLGGDLPADEVAQVEARLRAEPALRACRADLEQLDALASELPPSSLDAAGVEVLVRPVLSGRLRARRVIAVSALAVGLAICWGAIASRAPRVVATADVVTVDGVVLAVGDSRRAPIHITTTDRGAAHLWRGDEQVWLGADAEVRAGEALELVRGAVVVEGAASVIIARQHRFVVDGQALIAVEPEGTSFRETRDLSPEQRLMTRKQLMVAGGLSAAVLTLFVVRGNVAVVGQPSTGSDTLVRAGEHWAAGGSVRPASPSLTVAHEPDGGTAALPTSGIAVRVMAAGRALPGAAVRLFAFRGVDVATQRPRWEAVQSATSDATGEAGWNVEPGDYFITATAEGWATAQTRVSHAVGKTRTSVDVVLERGSVLRGRTEDARTGQPVVPATVTLTLRRGPAAEATTVAVDERGRFSVGPLPAGVWEVEGVSPGNGKGTAQVTLPQQAPVVVRFRGSGFVEGFVQYADGGAAAGATVMLVGEAVASGESSATGAFSLEAVPGVWQLQARAGELVGAAAGELDVRSSQTTRAGVIVLRASSRLSGRVLAGDAGVAHAAVIVMPHRGEGEVARGESDESGHYVVPLRPGSYDVVAEAGSRASRVERGLTVAQETKVDLMLELNGRIEGELVDARGASGVTVEARLQSVRHRVVSADGRFAFSDLPPGLWSVSALRADERVSATTTSKVEAGKTAQARLVIEPPAVFEGSLTWKCPGAPTPVTVKALTPWLQQVVPASEGRYRIELAPGSYWVVAASDDGACEGGAEGRERLEVRAGETRRLDLVLAARTKGVEVLVTDSAGQPVHQAMVTFLDATTPSRMLDLAFTDERGLVEHGTEFREGVASGPLLVQALRGARTGKSAPFRLGSVPRVTVALDDSTSLDLELIGLAEGQRARLELVGMPTFSFQDSLIVTTPKVHLDAVPGGRLHVTARTDDAAGEGEVVLQPGSSGRLTVELVPGGAVAGRLVTKDGQPRQGWVGLLTMAGEESSEAVPVDGTGHFLLRPVPPGTWKLTLMGEGLSRVVTVQSGVTTEVGDFGR